MLLASQKMIEKYCNAIHCFSTPLSGFQRGYKYQIRAIKPFKLTRHHVLPLSTSADPKREYIYGTQGSDAFEMAAVLHPGRDLLLIVMSVAVVKLLYASSFVKMVHCVRAPKM